MNTSLRQKAEAAFCRSPPHDILWNSATQISLSLELDVSLPLTQDEVTMTAAIRPTRGTEGWRIPRRRDAGMCAAFILKVANRLDLELPHRIADPVSLTFTLKGTRKGDPEKLRRTLCTIMTQQWLNEAAEKHLTSDGPSQDRLFCSAEVSFTKEIESTRDNEQWYTRGMWSWPPAHSRATKQEIRSESPES